MGAIVTLLTGLTDLPLEDLGGKTPLQKAHHPNLDELACSGELISFLPPEGGGQERALLALCGVSQGLYSSARAPLEALAIGYQMKRGEIAFCLRFAAAGEGVIIDVSNELLSDREGELFCDLLTAEFQSEGFRFLHLRGPRALLIVEQSLAEGYVAREMLSPAEIVGRRWEELIPAPALRSMAQRGAELIANSEVNLLKVELEEERVNAMLFYQGGVLPEWEKSDAFSRALLITTSPASCGAAKSIGLPSRLLPAEVNKYSHLEEIRSQLTELMGYHDLLIVEFRYLWESTYRGDLLEKIKAIEWLDRHWIGPLFEFCKADAISLALLPLRNSDIRYGRLISGPVPAIIYRGCSQRRSMEAFDESSCARFAVDLPVDDLSDLLMPVVVDSSAH
jgi:2,3-bisphosphoglycerate-independent phosphoglycerate mutase